MRVLGIDPGYAIVGWGVVDYAGNRFAPVDFGAVCTDAGVPFERRLDEVYITVNKNAIPNDPEKPFVTSGIRLGTPAMTTRGFGAEEVRETANLIVDLLEAPGDEAVLERVRLGVKALTERFPVYR